MEREGIATDKGDELRAIREENAERARIYETVREVAAEVPDAPARFMASRAAGADLPDAFEQWGAWAREQLERLHELALAAVERVQEMAVSAWDNLVAAMSPMSDFHMAERAAAEEREAELDRAIDEALAEMDLPEPQTAHENGEHEAEPPELGDDDDWLDRLLDEMDHEDAWDRGYEREHDHELEM